MNGSLETGWRGVGALVFSHTYDGYGSKGIFCTGTLVRPQWVLTAAHCVRESGYTPAPYIMHFYVGEDARTSGVGLPTTGELFAADAVFVHPSYSSRDEDADIALVHLARPAVGVPSYALNTSAALVESGNPSLLYVGFGVDDGVAITGQGIKRSTSMIINSSDAERYYSDYVGSGTCFGDSGGPGLYGDESDAVIVGVNSKHYSGGGVDCRDGYAARVRVDTFYTWLQATMDGPLPSCVSDASLCSCSAGCRGDGTCDVAACATQTCGEILSCDSACGADPDCVVACYANGTPTAAVLYQAMFECGRARCPDLEGTRLMGCISSRCPTELGACEADDTEPMLDGGVSDGGTFDGGTLDGGTLDGGAGGPEDAGSVGPADGGALADGSMPVDAGATGTGGDASGCSASRGSSPPSYGLMALLFGLVLVRRSKKR